MADNYGPTTEKFSEKDVNPAFIESDVLKSNIRSYGFASHTKSSLKIRRQSAYSSFKH